jgi:enoyl-CoA hydratase
VADQQTATFSAEGSHWRESIQTVSGGIYRIQLNRPEQRNALTPELYREIASGVIRASHLDEVDVIVLSGSPGAFAAGGDLKRFLELLEVPAEDYGEAFNEAFGTAMPFQPILQSPKPVVAAVDGLCLAGGLLLALVSDVVLATERSSFSVPEGLVGLADDFGATLLPMVVGLSRARYLMLTATRFDAQSALQWGVVHELVAPDQLEDAIVDVVARLQATSPDSKRVYKQIANQRIPHMAPEVTRDFARLATAREGLEAFKAKRPPAWARRKTATEDVTANDGQR